MLYEFQQNYMTMIQQRVTVMGNCFIGGVHRVERLKSSVGVAEDAFHIPRWVLTALLGRFEAVLLGRR